MEENNYFLNLMRSGIDYADKEIGLEGIIPLPKPYYSYTLNPRPGFQPDAYTYNSNVYNVSNPINPDELSKYDLVSGTQEGWTQEDRMNYLQLAQSTADKIGNALVNNLVIAGTTMASNVLSIPVGLFWMAGGNNFIDNPVNRISADIQKKTSEAFPIYRGTDYEDKSLWGKMGTNVFWADLIQNLGFTEGMMASGVLFNGATALGNIKNASWAISAINSIGEASVEAINRKDEILNERMSLLNEQFNKMLPDAIANGTTDELYNQYADMQKQIESDVIKAQNLIFAGNVALLTLTNQVEFGKYLDKGFDTERRFFKGALKGTDGKYLEISKGQAVARGIGRASLNAGTEAGEEFSQDVLQKWPTSFSTNKEDSSMFGDFNKFNESMFNPEKKELASDMWNGLWDALVETLHDPNTATDAMTGFITGLFGMPVRKMTSAGLKTQSWAGGLPGAINEAFNAHTNTNEVIRLINEYIQKDSETKAYYQSLVRDLVLLDEKEIALFNDDKKTYRDIDNALILNEALLYSHLGKTEDLKAKVNNYLNMSDEELQLIVNEIAETKEDNQYTVEDLKESIRKRSEFILDKIDFVDLTKKELLSKNPLLSDESLNSLIFLENQIQDWRKRRDELTDSTFEDYKKIVNQADLINSIGERQGLNYVKNGKFFSNDTRNIIEYIPGEPITSYYINNEGKTYKRNNIVVKKLPNGNFVEIKDYSSIKENDGTIYVVDKNALYKSDKKGEYIYVSPEANRDSFGLYINGSLEFRDDLKEYANDLNSGLTITEIENLESSIDDLVAINKSLENFYKQRDEVIGNIQKQNEVEAKKEAEVAKKTTTRRERKEKDNFADALNVKDLRKKLNNSKLSNEKKKQILDSLEKDGNEVAKTYNNIEKYYNELIGQLKSLAKNDDYFDNAKSLVNSGYYSSDTLNDFANPQGGWLNNTEYFVDRVAGDPYNAYQEAAYLVNIAMVNINSNDVYRAQFVDSYRQMTIKNPFKELSDTSSNSVIYVADEVLKDENNNTLKSLNDVSPISSGTLESEINDLSNDLLLPPESTKLTSRGSKSKPLYKYYRSGIPQFDKQQVTDKDFSLSFAQYRDKVTNSKEEYYVLEKYLEEEGAFDYVNSGKLKEDSKIGFMINPKYTYNGKPVIFMVLGTQVLNVLGGNTSTAEYVGVDKFMDIILDEYEKQKTEENKDDKFYSNIETTVSKIMNGNIAYSKVERSLDSSKTDSDKDANDHGVQFITKDKEGKDVQPILGIVKNRRINTNNKIDEENIVNAGKMSKYSGRVLLLVPTATGKYFAVPLRTKHFNEKEFDMSSNFGLELLERFKSFVNINSQDDLFAALRTLNKYMNLGGIHFNLLNKNKKRIDNNAKEDIYHLQIIKEIKDDNGHSLGAGRQEEVLYVNYYPDIQEGDEAFVKLHRLRDEDILQQVIDTFMKLNLQIQINVNEINTGQYNKYIIESDLLSSNLERGDIVNSWFTIGCFNEKKNKFEEAINPPVSEAWEQKQIDDRFNFVDGQLTEYGMPITLKENNVIYIYDMDTLEVRDKAFNIVTDIDETTKELLSDLCSIYTEYGQDALETPKSSQGIYKLPYQFGYKYLDINTQLYVKDEKKINEVNQKLKEKEGLNFGITDLQNKIDHNQGLIVFDKDTGETEVFDGDDRIHAVDVKEKLPQQYSGKSLTQNQIDALYGRKTKDGRFDRRFSKKPSIAESWLFYNLKNFSSVDALLNGETIVKNGEERKITGMREFIESRLRKYGVINDETPGNVIESMLPTDDENQSNYWNSEQYKADILLSIEDAMLEHIGSESAPMNKANQNFKIFVLDYFKHYFDRSLNDFQYSTEKDYGMKKDQFDGFKKRLDNFIRDRVKQGSRIVSVGTLLFHRYKNNDDYFYTDIDIIIVDINGHVNLVKTLLSKSSWLTTDKNGKNPHFLKNDNNPNQNLTDELQISNELLAAKSIFESQYLIKVNNVALMPFTVILDNNNLISEISTKDTGEDGYKLLYNPSKNNKNNLKLDYTITDTSRGAFRELDNLKPEGVPLIKVFSSNISLPTINRQEQPETVEEKPEQFMPAEPEEEPLPEISGEIIDDGGGGELVEYDYSADADSETDAWDNALFGDEASTEGDEYYRLISNDFQSLKQIDLKHEIDVVTKFIPQLSDKSKNKIVDALIKLNDGRIAMGKFKDSMITISNLATEGTYYHEAFHFVFNTLFSPSERVSILAEAADQFGGIGAYNLEEALADEFMHYVQYKHDRGYLAKIKAFFEDMINCIRCWFGLQPNIRFIFYKINRGKYSNRIEKTSDNTIKSMKKYKLLDTTKFDKLKSDVLQLLKQKGWTQSMFDSMSEEERLQAVTCIGI